MIADALTYPFKGAGWLLLLMGTVFGMVLEVASTVPVLGLIAMVFYFGYFAAYYYQILQNTATGHDGEPEWPDVTDFMEDILSPLFQVFGVFLISNFLLFLALMSYPSDDPVVLAAMAFGLFYFPMGLLAVAILGHVGAANPVRVLVSIIKTFPTYLLVGGVLVGLSFVIDFVVERLLGPGFLVWGISTFLALTFITAHARLLGLFYRKEEERLDWL